MKNYHNNPRKISPAQIEALKRDLVELGDLSGIVHDKNTDEIIGGNQRSGIFDINNCEIEITKEYDKPTATGTIAEGFILWNGERYSYRKVDWTPEQCEKACIVANKGGGEWDWGILSSFDRDDLIDWGFDKWEFESLVKKGKTEFTKKPKNEGVLPADEAELSPYDWIKSKNNIYVQFSGGKDSMATVGDLLKNGVKKENMTVLWCKTPMDYRDLDDFVRDFCKNNGLKLKVASNEKWIENREENFKRCGFPLPHKRWCTGVFKVLPMKKVFRELKAEYGDDLIICQGWRAEESERRAVSSVGFIDSLGNRMARPIMNMKEAEVFALIEEMSWEPHPCYKYKSRLSCVFCPAVSRDEWNTVRENDPANFLEALEIVSLGAESINIGIKLYADIVRRMCGHGNLPKKQKKGLIKIEVDEEIDSVLENIDSPERGRSS